MFEGAVQGKPIQSSGFYHAGLGGIKKAIALSTTFTNLESVNF